MPIDVRPGAERREHDLAAALAARRPQRAHRAAVVARARPYARRRRACVFAAIQQRQPRRRRAQEGVERPAAIGPHAAARPAPGSRWPLPATWTKRCSSPPPAAGRNSTSTVKRARPASGLASTSSPSSTPSNSTTEPAAVSTTRGAPTTVDRHGRRFAAGCRAATRPAAPSAAAVSRGPIRAAATAECDDQAEPRGGRMRTYLRAERADEHAHVADVGVDRDAHQRRIRERRGVGGRRRRGSARSRRARPSRGRPAIRDGCCSRAAPASSPAR